MLLVALKLRPRGLTRCQTFVRLCQNYGLQSSQDERDRPADAVLASTATWEKRHEDTLPVDFVLALCMRPSAEPDLHDSSVKSRRRQNGGQPTSPRWF